MQSIEGIISLMFLVSILSFMALEISEQPEIDDSLYRYQLAGDVWRVASLRGDFKDFDSSKNSPSRDQLQTTFEEVEAISTLCPYLSGKVVTPCSQKKMIERIASINHVLYDQGVAENVTLTIAYSQD
jgi:hypothetical protein